MENWNYKNEKIERKYLNIIWKNQFLKVKNSLLKLEKDFIELKDIERKVREVKLKKEIEELFIKPIMVSIDDMDRFEEEEMKKIRPIKKTWYGWLFNCIPKPARKSASVLKDIFISIFKTNTPKQIVYGRGQKLNKPRKQIVKKPFTSEENKQKIKDKIIKDIWKLFEREEEKQERKESEKKKKHNKRIIKDKIIRDIRTLFEQEEDYYKPKIVNSFWNNIYIEYESNGDKNNNLSLDEYLNKIKPSLKDIRIDL